MDKEICIDHGHSYAEDLEPVEDIPSGYSGHLMTRLLVDGQEHELYGADSAAMTDILTGLDYDPDAVCRCMSDITVDTEMLTGIQVSLGQAFARCELGQAALTEMQVMIIREIIENLQ